MAAERIDLLVNLGYMLRIAHSRQLDNGLLELRFDMSRRSMEDHLLAPSQTG